MASLVEVHDDEELDAALKSGAEIIGVNNRDLRTFDVRLETSHRLAARIPKHIIKVTESGIRDANDVRALMNAGFDAFLVGEHLMKVGRSRCSAPEHAMFVKICGLTNLEDTLAAAEEGATAAGFNFYSGSPRYIAPEALAPWIAQVPAGMWKVGVFVDEPVARVIEISHALGLDIAQLHGKETPADVPPGMRVWKAARIIDGYDFSILDAFQTEALLLDGPANGIPFDWNVAQGHGRRIVLAGGLDIDNVREAIERVRPWGVDLCSRIESTPGKKDHARMKRFIQTVLSC